MAMDEDLYHVLGVQPHAKDTEVSDGRDREGNEGRVATEEETKRIDGRKRNGRSEDAGGTRNDARIRPTKRTRSHASKRRRTMHVLTATCTRGNDGDGNAQIRRAYRNLVTREHPDKGGDPQAFAAIQRAYDVLSHREKRKQYDATGKAEKTVDEEFMESFGGGAFRDKMREQEQEKYSMAEQITVVQDQANQSHSAGFEAWLNARGESANQVFTAEDVAEQYGVVKSSYEAVPLPPIKAYEVQCNAVGHPKDALEMNSRPIPPELEWGEVLVNFRAIPINPGDLYAVVTGATGDGIGAKPPFVPGNDGLAVVVKVGPGIKGLSENDWVIPFKQGAGTWRSLAVLKEKDLLKIPVDIMPIEHAAMIREFCVAYRLLEDYGNLRPGDTVILNAANSTIGQIILQLCHLLRLRTVAVVREGPDVEKCSTWLKTLGANEVILDTGSVKLELDKKKYFAKPKLALDCVGGASALRLADTLQDGGLLVVYGCMSGKSPNFPWTHWIFKQLQVRGFSLRNWMKDNKNKILPMLESLSKLINADKLRVNYTEYELATEFDEALDHALEDSRNTKVLLKVNDIGVTY